MGTTEGFQFDGKAAKYLQVAADMRRRIARGDLPLGESVRDLYVLAEYYGCSWGTVRAAEGVLVDEGLLSEIRPGMPTRVIGKPAETEPDPTLVKLRKFRRELDELIAELEGGAPAA